MPRPSPRPSCSDRLLVGLIEGLTWLCARIGIDGSLALATVVGRAWSVLRGPRTRRVREALARAFPEKSASERADIERTVFVELARGLAEVLLLRGSRRAALLARVELVGRAQLETARARSAEGGVLLVSAHLGNWELACAKAAALGIPLSVVYRPQRRPSLDRLLAELRARAGREVGGAPIELIPRGRAGVATVRALRAGRAVLVLLDQDARGDEGEFVTFFGQPASTRSGALVLAARRGVEVVPAFSRREEDGRRHRIEIQPALPLEAGAANDRALLLRNLQCVSESIEAAIRAAPGQWIWTHRRWRTRPQPGDPIARPQRGAASGGGEGGSGSEGDGRKGAEVGAGPVGGFEVG